jgi:hypothetical protein
MLNSVFSGKLAASVRVSKNMRLRAHLGSVNKLMSEVVVDYGSICGVDVF